MGALEATAVLPSSYFELHNYLVEYVLPWCNSKQIVNLASTCKTLLHIIFNFVIRKLKLQTSQILQKAFTSISRVVSYLQFLEDLRSHSINLFVNISASSLHLESSDKFFLFQSGYLKIELLVGPASLNHAVGASCTVDDWRSVERVFARWKQNRIINNIPVEVWQLNVPIFPRSAIPYYNFSPSLLKKVKFATFAGWCNGKEFHFHPQISSIHDIVWDNNFHKDYCGDLFSSETSTKQE